jgi:hypothetical protein
VDLRPTPIFCQHYSTGQVQQLRAYTEDTYENIGGQRPGVMRMKLRKKESSEKDEAVQGK